MLGYCARCVPTQMLSASIVLALLFVVLPLCSSLSLLFTRSSASGFVLSISCLFLSASSSLCRYLRSCIGAPLLHSVSSHPRPTHTLCPCTVGRMHVHAQHSKQLFFPYTDKPLNSLLLQLPKERINSRKHQQNGSHWYAHTHANTHWATDPWVTTHWTPTPPDIVHLFLCRIIMQIV